MHTYSQVGAHTGSLAGRDMKGRHTTVRQASRRTYRQAHKHTYSHAGGQAASQPGMGGDMQTSNSSIHKCIHTEKLNIQSH